MKKGYQEENIDVGNIKWYEEYPKGEEPCQNSKSKTELSNLKDEAKRYLAAETSIYQLKQSKSTDSETSWLRTALAQGTTSDKVAAAIVLIQDNPKYNLAKLTMLINQVRIVKHNQCDMVIKSLKDLFLADLLHPNFKLLRFEEQNLNELEKSESENGVLKLDAERKQLMAHWYFEDQLYEHYERFVMSLATIASDTIDTNREIAISVMTDLLIGNAEQEHKLLELIVNKIGDPSNKIGSKVIFCLNKLLHKHPNMKLVVLKEAEKLLFRKNVAQRTQYYAICLLTQFLLHRDDEKIASTLIEVYFAFFKACLKKGEPDSRMMAALLTGVNRAYPFSKMESKILHTHIDSVYKVVHIGSFNVSLNALNLLYQVTGKDEVQSNRFYCTFYRKLLDPQIGIANKRALFLNLLFRVLQKDNNVQRLYAFIRRSLQIAIYFPANMTCAVLYVISKVLSKHKMLKTYLLKPEDSIKIETEENLEYNTSVDKSNLEDSILLSNVISEHIVKEEMKSEIKKDNNKNINTSITKEYNPFCRNPLYAGITKGLITELITLSKHYHPSVTLFANTIIEGKPIDYTGDPLIDLSLVRFLDRYVFKNPKKLEDKKILKKNDPLALRAGYSPKGIRCIPVDSTSYVNEREERIPVDELYLYRYMKKRNEFKHEVKIEDDIESVNSEEFDDMLDRLTHGKDFNDLDIAGDIQIGRRRRKDVEEDEDLDKDSVESQASDDIDDIDNSEDIDKDDSDEFKNLSDVDFDMDDDVSDLDFNDDNDDVLDHSAALNISNQINKYNKKKFQEYKISQGTDSNIFVSAEKFSEMLEEHSKQKSKPGGTSTYSTVDGASIKQVEWEAKRHHKLIGSMNKNKRKSHKTFKKNVKKVKH